MSFSAPAPTRLLVAKAAVAATAITAVTALTVGVAAPAAMNLARPSDVSVSAPAALTVEQEVALMASIGLYPVGPGAQIARTLGFGTPQDALNNLAGLAGLIPGDSGTQLQASIESIAALLATAQEGIDLPLGIGNVGFPEIAVPPAGPAGTIDQVASLESGGLATAGLLSLAKTATMNGEGLAIALGVVGDLTGIDTEALETLVADLPLNVPGTAIETEVLGVSSGVFVSDADKFAIIPTWGLGGTNFALASPTFLNDETFAKTAILAIAMRNTSRTGGGILSLLNPLSQTVGLNLSNVDGRGTTTSDTVDVGLVDVTLETTTGNVTVWDVTAAYDLLSDAPSTVLNPLAWLNSGVGAVAPTYLIPDNVTDFAAVLEDITGGEIDIDTLNTLLGTINSSIDMFNINVGEDGNLYVTYDSGNLPLLEPIQFLPRTISYIPGFDISTPVSSSFEDVLTQLVAQGYQDVDMTLDDEGVATFVRGFDMAGTQAKFWQNPVSWEMGLETPQTVFNSIITGLQQNLLDPSKGEFELFGNEFIGNLVYRNAVSVAVAKFISDSLEQIRDTLNPVMNDAQDAFRPLAVALDKATLEVNKVIDSGLDEVSKLGVDLSGPLLDANRFGNQVGDGINNGIRGVFGLKPIESPDAFTPTTDEPESQNRGEAQSRTVLVAESTEVHTPPANAVPATDPVLETVSTNSVEDEPGTTLPDPVDEGPDGEVELDGDASSDTVKPSRTTLKDRLDKRAEKTERSLSRAQERAENVTRELRQGDLHGAANEVRKNVENRVDRLGKDIDNGVKKVRDAIGGGKKESSSGSDGDAGSGGSDSAE